MAIRDKNGGVYRLRGPNPLMSHQNAWDKSKMQLINLGQWQDEVVPDKAPNVVSIPAPKPPPAATPVSAQDFIREIQALEKEIQDIPEEPANSELNILFKTKGTQYFCAPAVGYKPHQDDFYGEIYQTVQYGEKFVFDAIILDQSDLELQLWCVWTITTNSIIYKKIKEGGERWWRVEGVYPKTGGHVVRAVPSNSCPDFS